MQTYQVFTATNAHGEVLVVAIQPDIFKDENADGGLPTPDEFFASDAIDIELKGDIQITGDALPYLPDWFEVKS